MASTLLHIHGGIHKERPKESSSPARSLISRICLMRVSCQPDSRLHCRNPQMNYAQRLEFLRRYGCFRVVFSYFANPSFFEETTSKLGKVTLSLVNRGEHRHLPIVGNCRETKSVRGARSTCFVPSHDERPSRLKRMCYARTTTPYGKSMEIFPGSGMLCCFSHNRRAHLLEKPLKAETGSSYTRCARPPMPSFSHLSI